MNKFDLLDENGKLKENLDPEVVESFNVEQAILTAEEVTIEGGIYARNFDELPRILNEYEGVLAGAEAEIYDRLLDELENQDAE